MIESTVRTFSNSVGNFSPPDDFMVLLNLSPTLIVFRVGYPLFSGVNIILLSSCSTWKRFLRLSLRDSIPR